MDIKQFLKFCADVDASDLHLKAGAPPVIRKDGGLHLLPQYQDKGSLTPEQTASFAKELLASPYLQKTFEKFRQVDVGVGISGVGRFRVNIFLQRGSFCLAARRIPINIPDFQDLNLPPEFEKIADAERGLILVTGNSGAGKSSTLAAILDHINKHKSKSIVTLEDPIEFLIADQCSIIAQRELGMDITSFTDGLKAALRQDTNVILVGEIRDQQTLNTALTAAETGHLVLSSMHTTDASETINRIMASDENKDAFNQKANQLATALTAVVCQRLVQKKDDSGLYPALEILVNNEHVKEWIQKDMKSSKELVKMIETSGSSDGLSRSFDQHLFQLIQSDIISEKEAFKACTSEKDLKLAISGVSSERFTDLKDDKAS